MKKLYFVRHGQSVLNVKGLLAGSTETPLTDEGRKQAKTVGQQIKKQLIKIDCIVASPRSRTLETAQIIADEIDFPAGKILTSDLLRERHYGSLEKAPFGPNLKIDDIVDFEHDEPLIKRARAALDWIESLPADNILVVSHGAFGRALRSVTKAEFPMSHPHRIGNAELLELI